MITPEIVDHILGFLRPDYTTLETCSAVFPQLVDHHLYSHINLYAPVMEHDTEPEEYYTPQFPDFLNQLIQRPQIAHCILGVRVIIAVLPAPLDRQTWEFLPVISAMLPILRNLQSIELCPWGKLSWNTLGPQFCTAFQTCLRLPSINQAKISNIDGFPLDSFDDCKNLKNLVLRGQFTGGEGVSTTESSYPPLTSLRMKTQNSQPASDLAKIVSWMKSDTLQTLSLHICQSMDLANYQPLISSCSATLVTLELDLSQCDEINHPDTLTDPRFQVLKHLILHSIIQPSEGSFSFLPGIAPFLTAFRSSPPSVQLSVHLRFCELPLIRRGDSQDLKWPDITLLDALAVFRQPIELRLVGPRFAIPRFGYLFDQSSDVQRLLASEKITIIDDS